MFAIEFETHIQRPSIDIPADQWEQLRSQINGGSVRVLVMPPKEVTDMLPDEELTPRLRDAKEKGYDDFIKYLMDHPISLPPGEKFLTREEANER